MKLKAAVACLMASFAGSAPSYGAIGGETGGGGDAVIFPDDTVILADPYLIKEGQEGTFNCPAGTEGTLAPELRDELNLIGMLLVRYGAPLSINDRDGFFRPSHHFDWSNRVSSRFIENHVFTAHFCFVDQLPKNEHLNLEAPAGARVESVGYTEGKVTWLRKDLFRAMSVREQAKTIVHERLHGFAGNIPHGPIVDITNSLEAVLSLYQAQQRGDRTHLNEEQILALNTLILRISQVLDTASPLPSLVSPGFQPKVVRNGGGVILGNTSVAEDAFIGVGSVVGPRVMIASGAEILASEVCWKNLTDDLRDDPGFTSIGKSVSIFHSVLVKCGPTTEMKERASVVKSMIASRSGFQMKPHSAISNSMLSGNFYFAMEQYATIDDSAINFEMGSGLDFSVPSFLIGQSARLLRLKNVTVLGHKGKTKTWYGRWKTTDEDALLYVSDGKVIDFENQVFCKQSSVRLGLFAAHVSGKLTITRPQDLIMDCW